MQLNGTEVCYLAALIEGLRLVNEKAAERRITDVQMEPEALIQYVRIKGERLLSQALEEDPDFAKKTIEVAERVNPEKIIVRQQKKRKSRAWRPLPGMELCECGKPFAHKGWCVFRYSMFLDHIAPQEKACIVPV